MMNPSDVIDYHSSKDSRAGDAYSPRLEISLEIKLMTIGRCISWLYNYEAINFLGSLVWAGWPDEYLHVPSP